MVVHDGALAEAALCIAEFARRPGDIVARAGGEEFALFLYDCDAGSATDRLQQLRKRLQALEIENVDSRHGVVTASIGAIVMDWGATVATAYKKVGRNQVVVGHV